MGWKHKIKDKTQAPLGFKCGTYSQAQIKPLDPLSQCIT